MRVEDESYRWQHLGFCLRVALSCVVVPLALPIPLLCLMRHSPRQDWLEGLMFIPIYDLFGTPAMVVLGIPLLHIYLRFGLTGYIPFMIGGAGCVLAVFDAIFRSPQQAEMFVIYGIGGALCGVLFRVLLFGFRFRLGRKKPNDQDSGRRSIGSDNATIAALGILFASAIILYYSADHHNSYSKTMNATCKSVQNTPDPYRPHQEVVRLVYSENPRFVEHLAGPALCTELQKSSQTAALVTFDVWHNWKTGRGGYMIRKISIGGTRRKTFGTMFGGFYPNRETYEQYTDSTPDPDRFPDFPLSRAKLRSSR